MGMGPWAATVDPNPQFYIVRRGWVESLGVIVDKSGTLQAHPKPLSPKEKMVASETGRG